MITVVDYRMGNLGSILNMLKKVGVSAEVTSDPVKIRKARALILPGVGRFDRAMLNLETMGIRPALDEAVNHLNVPTLGICLGMQLMLESSEEGNVPGLGWFKGSVRKIVPPPQERIPVPHMGWNELEITKQDLLFRDMGDEARFYFVHSYAVQLDRHEEVLAETSYGYRFVSVLGRQHVRGVQFHPEKSHRYGLQLLTNFARSLNEVE